MWNKYYIYKICQCNWLFASYKFFGRLAPHVHHSSWGCQNVYAAMCNQFTNTVNESISSKYLGILYIKCYSPENIKANYGNTTGLLETSMASAENACQDQPWTFLCWY